MSQRRRDDGEHERQRWLLLLLGLACLIQLFVSLQASRRETARWTEQREQETRQFERRIQEAARNRPPAEGAR